MNFISNSLKFTPVNGRITVMVKINGEQIKKCPADKCRKVSMEKNVHPDEEKNIFANINQMKKHSS